MPSDLRSEAFSARGVKVARRLGLSLMEPTDDLIDWRQIAGIAMDAAIDPALEVKAGAKEAEEFARYTEKVTPAISEFTGLELEHPLGPPVVFNRAEWITVTARNFKPILDEFYNRIIEPWRSPRSLIWGPDRFLSTAICGEIGLALGLMSTRVLGQYESSFLISEGHPGQIYFIYPNILVAEERLGLNPTDFRMWLALHEATHGFQFKANPWLKDYMKTLLDEQVNFVDLKLKKRGGREKQNGLADIMGGLTLTGSMKDLMNVDENPVLAKIQALMSVLEGYSEYVMAEVGLKVIGGDQRIGEIFDQSRALKSWWQKAIDKLIGLETKIAQYQIGRKFITTAADLGGMSLVNKVWNGPRSFPTLTELRHPEIWVDRIK